MVTNEPLSDALTGLTDLDDSAQEYTEKIKNARRSIVDLTVNKKVRFTFLLIALVQGLHSIEEAAGKLWEVYPPATYLSGLVSRNLKTGFIIINVSLFAVLMLTWFATFSKTISIKGWLWLWAVLEMINGAGHTIWAIIEGGYVPGLATAPVLMILALLLARLLLKETLE